MLFVCVAMNKYTFRMFTFRRHATYGISQIATAKDKIEQPDAASDEKMYIPPLGSAMIISGKSGSGKSTLLANLIKDERFYGPTSDHPDGWFDKIFLFSPTANGDDIQRSLGIPANHVFTNLEDAPELLDLILDTQQQKIDKTTADKVPQFAIIFDDVIGDVKFMNSKQFQKCFYQIRHVNCTTFICTQHFNRVPRLCRLQANFVFFFQGSQSEVETIVDNYAPPMYTKREFREMINDATNERYTFLTINMKVGWDLRFRRNLDEFIGLDRVTGETPDDHGTTDKDDKRESKKQKHDEKDEPDNHDKRGSKKQKIYDGKGNKEEGTVEAILQHYIDNGSNEQEDEWE
jgi:hypothetical protein